LTPGPHVHSQLDSLHGSELPAAPGHIDERIKEIFFHFAATSKPKNCITADDIRDLVLRWAQKHNHKNLHINRPKVLAMMRKIDLDRSGCIGYMEFLWFVLQLLKEKELLKQQELAAMESIEEEETIVSWGEGADKLSEGIVPAKDSFRRVRSLKAIKIPRFTAITAAVVFPGLAKTKVSDGKTDSKAVSKNATAHDNHAKYAIGHEEQANVEDVNGNNRLEACHQSKNQSHLRRNHDAISSSHPEMIDIHTQG